MKVIAYCGSNILKLIVSVCVCLLVCVCVCVCPRKIMWSKGSQGAGCGRIRGVQADFPSVAWERGCDVMTSSPAAAFCRRVMSLVKMFFLVTVNQ